ncbi:hypothetical protein ACFQS1_25390 [Paractinoplanes rhizophilus]|jgi:hypothetical protein|uniref:Ribosomal protein S14 n=1 Tax=Paractinoplanes rhizophilus TaxID=1416877 RepID=A0ABW2I042_9ACTN|nr:hypothetical protein [Actinoplanes sp.]
MIRLLRRTEPTAGVRFCDGCAEVTTPADRARRYRDRAILRAQTALGPR